MYDRMERVTNGGVLVLVRRRSSFYVFGRQCYWKLTSTGKVRRLKKDSTRVMSLLAILAVQIDQIEGIPFVTPLGYKFSSHEGVCRQPRGGGGPVARSEKGTSTYDYIALVRIIARTFLGLMDLARLGSFVRIAFPVGFTKFR